jgi:enoyl-CoA hydratase
MSALPALVSLRVTIADAIADVVLLGPGKGNAMGPDFWREMPLVFEALDRDASVRAIVVRGDGTNFSYGLDLVAMMGTVGPHVSATQMAPERQKLLDLIHDLQRACDSVAACRKPVLAAVAGWCIGGGVDLIAACDVRLASKGARFSLREVKVAMVADLGSLQRLPPIIGQGATRELAFTGKNIDADRALRIGLVSDVFENDDALFAAARAMAREIADNSPVVVQGIKQVMNDCADLSVAEGLRHVAVWNAAFLQSPDLAEAFTAFVEKRPPKFG